MSKRSEVIAVAAVTLFIVGTAIGVGKMVAEPERYISEPQQFSQAETRAAKVTAPADMRLPG